MDKRILKDSLRLAAEGAEMISVAQYMRFMGVSRHTAIKHLHGLDYFLSGNEKKYCNTDVAAMIFNKRLFDV